MAIVINGSGTVTGISVGGLPDGIVDSGTLATNSVDSAELIDGAIDTAHLASGVGGKVLQVVSATSTSASSTTSTTFVTSNLTADITPADATNKVLVLITSDGRVSTTGEMFYTLYEDGVNIGHSTKGMGKIGSGSGRIDVPLSLIHLASPASASAVTYTLYYLASSGITAECPPNADMIQNITLMEIAV